VLIRPGLVTDAVGFGLLGLAIAGQLLFKPRAAPAAGVRGDD
jgi:hypothetical protein